MNRPPGLYARLRRQAGEAWQEYVNHAFVEALADRSLPEENFRHYLRQDYVFLKHFSRAWALAVFKSESLDDMRAAAGVLHGLMDHEMAMHVRYCAGWGIDEKALAATPEARANLAYTRFVLERGLAGDLLDLLVALAPCVCGYAEIGRARIAHPRTVLEGNPYRDWLESYSGEEFQALAGKVIAQIDRLASERATEARMEPLARDFLTATRLEIDFWQMGLERLE